MKLQNKKGFTLIELLVVITIIGILATWATTVYTSQIQKARDTTRINDMKALQSAVEQVYQDRWEYPSWNAFVTDGSEVAVWTYMPRIPRDPKNGQTCNNGWDSTVSTACVYAYKTEADDNWINKWVYVLSTWFESLWKVQSDWNRDGWTYNYRWETWNGITKTDPVEVDVIHTSQLETDAKTASWVLNSACTSAPSSETEIITIHWS